MPFRKSKPKSRRPYAKRRMVRRAPRRNPLPRAPTGSFATRAETFSNTYTAGSVKDLNDISLTYLPACTQLANLYQYYRITSVQWRLKPNFDTYVSGGSAGTGIIPYLYFLYDKSGSLGNLNADQFEECGAKPVRVDDKTIIRKWRPTVRISGADGPVPMFKTSPWMPTQDLTGTSQNIVKHLGAVWYVSKSNFNDAQQYDIDITVTVQFRKPLVPVVAR